MVLEGAPRNELEAFADKLAANLRQAQALELLEKAVTAHPLHPLNHLFYAQALWNEGDAATLPQVKAEFALGEKLLAAGDWGYSKQAWEKEFAEFKREFLGSE